MAAVLAIDPGVNGGVAFLPLKGKWKGVMYARPLPTRPGPKGLPEIDVNELLHMVNTVQENSGQQITLAVMEIVHATPVWSKVACFKFGKTYGAVLAILELSNYPIEFVTPQRWKKVVLKGLGTDKTAAFRWCQQRHPKLKLNAKSKKTGKRSTKLHDGMADAACLAEYGRLTLK